MVDRPAPMVFPTFPKGYVYYPFTEEDKRICWETARQRSSFKSPTHRVDKRLSSKSFLQLDYIHARGEWAVSKYLDLPVTVKKGSGGVKWNFLWGGKLPIQVKTTKDRLMFQTLETFRAGIAVWCHHFNHTDDVIIAGWTTDSRFKELYRVDQSRPTQVCIMRPQDMYPIPVLIPYLNRWMEKHG